MQIIKNLSDIKKEYVGLFGLFIVTIFWGFGFVWVDITVNTIRPPYIVGIRMAIASLIIFLIFMPKILKTTKKDILYSIPIAIALFLGFILQTYAAEYMTVGKVSFFTGANVVMVPFLSFFIFKTDLSIKSFLCAIIAIVGLGILALEKDFSIKLYDIFGLLCALFLAMHITLVGNAARKIDAIILTFWQLFIAAILSFAFGFIINEPISISSFSTNVILSLIALGLFSTFIAYALQNICQKYTTASKASLVLSLESFIGAVLGIIILGELFSMRLLVGGGLVLLAIIISEINFKVLRTFKLHD